jgi:mono/diheme cytochrome c family protein
MTYLLDPKRMPYPMTTLKLIALLSLCLFNINLSAETRAEKLSAQLSQPPNQPWWDIVDTGPFISDTIINPVSDEVAALKGLAIKLGEDEKATIIFDTQMLSMIAGFDGRVKLKGTAWNGRHTDNTHYSNNPHSFYFHNHSKTEKPGWFINGNKKDPRKFSSGPLPHDVARYKGLFRHGNKTILSYQVAATAVLEWPWLETADGVTAITRTLNIEKAKQDLTMVLRSPSGVKNKNDKNIIFLVNPNSVPEGVILKKKNKGKKVYLHIPKGTPAFNCKIVYAKQPMDPALFSPAKDLKLLTRGGPGIYPETITVQGVMGEQSQPYTVDTLPLPSDNPWKSKIRFGAFDFFEDGKRIAASTWNGDVWIADGIDGDMSSITWKRYASGLYQTLGLIIVEGVIYTQGRDQITRLHDLNNDGEADFYENFNNDVQITRGFHEFSFDLQTDAEGNFYFSKGMPVNAGGKGFGPWTQHNGTVLKVSADGKTLQPIAWGLRAPGGLGISPDGIVTTGENEGSWVPRCKITWNKPDEFSFNGVVPSEWKGREFVKTLPGAPEQYEKPLVWLPYFVDNSSGSQLWVPQDANWGPGLNSEMLHLSYGKSSIYRVLREEVNGQVQGGVQRMPIDLSIAGMRARFHPKTGEMYIIGFRGWQTSGGTGLQRIRFTGNTTPQPVGLEAYENGMLVRFSSKLDKQSAQDPFRFAISKWKYMWTPQYGSGRFSIDHPDAAAEAKAWTTPSKGSHNKIDTVTIGASRLLEDGKSVFIYIPKMTTAMQMEIKMDLLDKKGNPFRETLYNTVHELRPAFKIAGVDFDKIKVIESPAIGEHGLLVSFGGSMTDTLRTSRFALTVPEGTPPSAFLDSEPFEATWQGNLIVPERDSYTFSVEGSGFISLQISGKEILQGTLPIKASTSITLNKGSHPIFGSFKSPVRGDSRVRLKWESAQFKPEPVPASAFRFIPDANYETWKNIREGREIFAQSKCIKCHGFNKKPTGPIMPELTYTAPNLNQLTTYLTPSWLSEQISQPKFQCPTVAAEDQLDLTAFLLNQQKQHGINNPIEATDQAIESGQKLIQQLSLESWLKPLIDESRFTRDGLQKMLIEPAMYEAHTTFPDFHLTAVEAAQITAAAFKMWGGNQHNLTSQGNIGHGKSLYEQQCTACHSTEPAPPPSLKISQLFKTDWSSRGCAAADPGEAPDLRLTRQQRQKLLALSTADRNAGIKSLNRFSHAEYAERQIDKLNCGQCHSGQNNLPYISNAGAKLKTPWIASLLKGSPETKVRPWLKERMPAFPNHAEKLAKGMAATHGVDYQPGDSQLPDSLLAAKGEILAGTSGYSCVLCHAAGKQDAVQAFEGQGPNLQFASQRLRYDYYQQWMHWPQRIAPDTIMPRYTKDKASASLDTHFNGNAGKQFEAIWEWMKMLQN